MASSASRRAAAAARSSGPNESAAARARRPRAMPGLDGLIHHRLRLGILSALAGTEHLSFNALKSVLQTTDGNLSVHARKLEEAEYIACTKSFEDRRPLTRYSLTAAGRRALQQYVDHMDALLRATRESLEL